LWEAQTTGPLSTIIGSEARVAAVEALDGPFESWSAMILPMSAYSYHEQRKFAKALVYYRKAIEAARGATMNDDVRHFVVVWMRIGIKLWLHSASVVEMPAYPEAKPLRSAFLPA
jgi:hypothetical protein